MTTAQLLHFFAIRDDLRRRVAFARSELDECSALDVENNLTCDHRYPSGAPAGPEYIDVGPNHVGVCTICRCGVDWERVKAKTE